MQFIEAQVLDALHLRLSQRLAISPGSKVFITIAPPEELVAEHEAQAALSAQGLAGAYGDQEPEYSAASIKKPNPEFCSSFQVQLGNEEQMKANKAHGVRTLPRRSN